jgi:hypothetical protein
VAIAKILKETFGSALVRAELTNGELVVIGFEGRDKVSHTPTEGGLVDVETLPSPEDLKGKILLKVCLPKALLVELTDEIFRRRICMSLRTKR